MISIVLGSVAAMGAAFLGTKVYPLQKGGTIETATDSIQQSLDTVKESIQAEPQPEPLATETTTPLETEVAPVPESTEQISPEFS